MKKVCCQRVQSSPHYFPHTNQMRTLIHSLRTCV